MPKAPNEDIMSILQRAEQDGPSYIQRLGEREIRAAGTTRKDLMALYEQHHAPRRQQRVREGMAHVVQEEKGGGPLDRLTRMGFSTD